MPAIVHGMLHIFRVLLGVKNRSIGAQKVPSVCVQADKKSVSTLICVLKVCNGHKTLPLGI